MLWDFFRAFLKKNTFLMERKPEENVKTETGVWYMTHQSVKIDCEYSVGQEEGYAG